MSGIPVPAGVRLHAGRVARTITSLLGADAVTLRRRILLSPAAAGEVARGTDAGRRLVAHELSHVAQYARLGTARFLFLYAVAYAAGRLRRLSHEQAYRAISFERQAAEAEESV